MIHDLPEGQTQHDPAEEARARDKELLELAVRHCNELSAAQERIKELETKVCYYESALCVSGLNLVAVPGATAQEINPRKVTDILLELAALKAQMAEQEPVAVYEADTDHLQTLQDQEMAKGWRWFRKDFKRGEHLYLHPAPIPEGMVLRPKEDLSAAQERIKEISIKHEVACGILSDIQRRRQIDQEEYKKIIIAANKRCLEIPKQDADEFNAHHEEMLKSLDAANAELAAPIVGGSFDIRGIRFP